MHEYGKMLVFYIVPKKKISLLSLKKDGPIDKSSISKVYERLIYNQLSDHAESFLNQKLCGFRKT